MISHCFHVVVTVKLSICITSFLGKVIKLLGMLCYIYIYIYTGLPTTNETSDTIVRNLNCFLIFTVSFKLLGMLCYIYIQGYPLRMRL